MMKLNSGKVLILLSVVAVASMLAGLYATVYATSNSNTSTTSEQWGNRLGLMTGQLGPGPGFMGGGRMRGGEGCNGFIEVSVAYNETVINIIESDTDVQNLLTEGYTISAVRPVIKSVVEADGTVVTKATSAIVMLAKDTTGRASVYVDVTAGKVTRIEILTRTVIDKP